MKLVLLVKSNDIDPFFYFAAVVVKLLLTWQFIDKYFSLFMSDPNFVFVENFSL